MPGKSYVERDWINLRFYGLFPKDKSTAVGERGVPCSFQRHLALGYKPKKAGGSDRLQWG